VKLYRLKLVKHDKTEHTFFGLGVDGLYEAVNAALSYCSSTRRPDPIVEALCILFEDGPQRECAVAIGPTHWLKLDLLEVHVRQMPIAQPQWYCEAIALIQEASSLLRAQERTSVYQGDDERRKTFEALILVLEKAYSKLHSLPVNREEHNR